MENHLVVQIVESLAYADQVSPTDLDYHLQEYIDVDAIVELMSHQNGVWELTFQVPDHEVRVTSSGHLYIDDVPFESSSQRPG